MVAYEPGHHGTHHRLRWQPATERWPEDDCGSG